MDSQVASGDGISQPDKNIMKANLATSFANLATPNWINRSQFRPNPQIAKPNWKGILVKNPTSTAYPAKRPTTTLGS